MSSALRNASTAFAVSLLLVSGAASASKPAAMKAASSASTKRPTKKQAAAKVAAEVAVAEAKVESAAVSKVEKQGFAFKIGRAIGKAARVVWSPVRTFKAFRMRTAETRAAKKDFKTWLSREDNTHLKTYLAGARTERSVRSQQLAYGLHAFNSFFTAGMTGATAAMGMYPLAVMNGALSVFSTGMKVSIGNDIARSIRDANTQTVDFAVGSQSRFVAAARLDRWAKAGIIDAKYTRTMPAATVADGTKNSVE